MSIVLVEILIVVALFVANGVFAMSEMAVVSSRKSRLKQMAADGDAGAAAALRLAEADKVLIQAEPATTTPRAMEPSATGA